MQTTYFLDTCIWIDFYENRVSKTGAPLGRYAKQLFIKILKNKDIILLSDTILFELRQRYEDIEITNLLQWIDKLGSLIKIDIRKEDYLEASKLSKERNLPKNDCLNAIQSRNNRAILISQDRHFFNDLSDITKAKKPQDII